MNPPTRPRWRLWLASTDSRHLAVLFALGFALVWSLVEVLVTRLYQAYSLVQVEGLRFGVQLLLMLLLWPGRRGGPAGGWRLWHTRRPLLHLLRGLSMLALPFAFAAAMYSGVSLPLALSGLWLAPLFALGLAALWLRDRASPLLWLAALAGLGAVVLILAPGRPASPLALLMPVLSGLALAAYLALTRLLRDEPVQTGLFWVAAVAVAVMLPFLPGVWVQPSLRDALILAAIGVFGYLALWLLDQALRRWSVSHLAPVLYTHVVVLHWLPSLLHGERPSLRLVLGSAVIAGVALFVCWRASVRRQRARAPVRAGVPDSLLSAPVPLH